MLISLQTLFFFIYKFFGESKIPSFPMPPQAAGGLSINDISKQLYLKKKILKQLGGSISEFHDSTLHPRRLVKTFKRKRRN
jgi:hypothetical protein